MVLFAAGPVLPADGCAEIELADIFFSVIGSNAIFVYIWVSLCPPTSNFSRVLFTGFSGCFGDADRFVFYLCNYALIWGVMYYMYKNRTFIKV